MDTCAPPITYDVTTLFAVYHLRDLRQLSLLSQASAPCGICCCCPYFTCQVAMCFTGSTESDLTGDFSDMGAGIRTVDDWTSTVNDLLNGASEENDASDGGNLTSKKASVIYVEIETIDQNVKMGDISPPIMPDSDFNMSMTTNTTISPQDNTNVAAITNTITIPHFYVGDGDDDVKDTLGLVS